MNNTDRATIAYHYARYCKNRANGDPVGGFEDINELFSDLRKEDKSLKEVFKEIEEEIFEEE